MDLPLLANFVNLGLILFCTSSTPPREPKELAILTDGTVVHGHLACGSDGLFLSAHSSGYVRIPLRSIREIRVVGKSDISVESHPAHTLVFWGNESLSGWVQSIDSQTTSIRMSVGELLEVPRYLIASIIHMRDEVVGLSDDFEEDAVSSRYLVGASLSEEQSNTGQRTCRLQRSGDSVTIKLAGSVGSGLFEVWYYDSYENRNDVEWICEYAFRSPSQERRLQVLLGWAADSYGLITPDGLSFAVRRIVRRAGWNLLRLRFSPKQMTLMVGRAVLGSAKVNLGYLHSIQFRIRQVRGPRQVVRSDSPLSAYVDDLRITQFVGHVIPWQPSVDQDDLRLINGDQLFGSPERQ